ncbi:MAG: hypothetical protein PHS84_08385 [Paludibacter sp.]|nr:hypothetical protein [Paludibacter sp.]
MINSWYLSMRIYVISDAHLPYWSSASSYSKLRIFETGKTVG